MKKQVSDEQFNQMREMLAAAECATKVVPLTSIALDDRSIQSGTIQVGGQSVAVGNAFFQKLAGMLKVNRSLTSEMIKNEDGKIATSLINGLKDYRSAKGGNEVMLIANPNTREVIDICDPKRFRRLTNESVFDVTSKIMNDNPNLSIETIDFNPHTGKSVINLQNVSHNVIDLWWDGTDLMGRIEILSTPSGNIAKELLKSGIRLGISSRGMGSVRNIGEGKVEVQDDFEIVCWDLVSNPSTQGAFMSPLNESISQVKTNKYTKVHSLINDIISVM